MQSAQPAAAAAPAGGGAAGHAGGQPGPLPTTRPSVHGSGVQLRAVSPAAPRPAVVPLLQLGEAWQPAALGLGRCASAGAWWRQADLGPWCVAASAPRHGAGSCQLRADPRLHCVAGRVPRWAQSAHPLLAPPPQAAGSGFMATGLSGAYLLVKAQQFFERAALAALAVQQVAVRGYGSTPSGEELQEAGNTCPICQDAFRAPLRLSCGHVFWCDCQRGWKQH